MSNLSDGEKEFVRVRGYATNSEQLCQIIEDVVEDYFKENGMSNQLVNDVICALELCKLNTFKKKE